MCFSVEIVVIFTGHCVLHEKGRWHLCSALHPLQHTEVAALWVNAILTSGLNQTSPQTRLVRGILFLYLLFHIMYYFVIMIIKFTVTTTKIMRITHLRKTLNLPIFFHIKCLVIYEPQTFTEEPLGQ